MIDEKRIKYFIDGAKEAFKEVDDTTFTFPINILSAYKLAMSIEELLKEQSEQKHGHWVLDPNGMDWNIPAWRCSECHCRNDNIPPNLERTNPLRWSGSKYCPNCGAKMDEEVK